MTTNPSRSATVSMWPTPPGMPRYYVVNREHFGFCSVAVHPGQDISTFMVGVVWIEERPTWDDAFEDARAMQREEDRA